MLHELKPLILGTRAVNTSFDSGVLGINDILIGQEDLDLGWCTINGMAVSPVIDENIFESFLYTDSYDEWYFFKEVPDDFDAVAFCNYLGLSLQLADELIYEGGCDLVPALARFKPTAIAGSNDAFSYFLCLEEAITASVLLKPRGYAVPTISMFYGILIRMFFYDTDKHHIPHIHAEYQGQVAVYAIEDGALLAGELPKNKHKLVVAWIEIHQEELMADWQLAVIGNKPFPIRGLDQ